MIQVDHRLPNGGSVDETKHLHKQAVLTLCFFGTDLSYRTVAAECILKAQQEWSDTIRSTPVRGSLVANLI